MKVLNPLSRVLIAFLVLSLSACAARNNSDEKKENEVSPLANYHEKTFRIKSNKTVDAGDSTYFYMAYPVFTDSTINRYVYQQVVLDSGETSVQDMGKSFIANYEKVYDDLPNKWAWFEQKNVSVIMETKNYLGFDTHFESYTGGAHGIHYVLYHNYNIAKDKEIQLKDLVLDYGKLSQVAEVFFRKQEGISSNHSLSEGYFFDQGIFHISDNFTLTKDSLLVVYNVYDIKPYSSGITELSIPYTALKDILNSDAKTLIAELKK